MESAIEPGKIMMQMKQATLMSTNLSCYTEETKNGKREEALDLSEVSRNSVPYFHAWANYTNLQNFHCLFVLGLTGAFSVTLIWILPGAKPFLPQWTKSL